MSTKQTTGLNTIMDDKTIKAKQKTAIISDMLLTGVATTGELIDIATTAKDGPKATLVEAMEYATGKQADIIDAKAFEFAIKCLADDAPRVKWEAAKVIANTAHLFPKLQRKAIANLLPNTEHDGKVVRWSAAGALAKIVVLNTPLNKDLVPAARNIMDREQEDSVKKIYAKALKNVK